MSYVITRGVVAPKKLAPLLDEMAEGTGCSYASVYRGSDAAALLHSIGKHTQAEIYEEYIHGEEPNPANPPGRSTHELRSDGVPYPGPVGRHLAWWQCGMDIDDAHITTCVAWAWSKHKWTLFRPYPTGSEYHHLNFRKAPKVPLPFLPLKLHSKGVWVRLMRQRLKRCGYHVTVNGKPINSTTETVIKRFQRQHHLAADGVVGVQTWQMIKARASANKRLGAAPGDE